MTLLQQRKLFVFKMVTMTSDDCAQTKVVCMRYFVCTKTQSSQLGDQDKPLNKTQ